jgi:hypothetical protein
MHFIIKCGWGGGGERKHIEVADFWDVALCSLVDTGGKFQTTFLLPSSLTTLMMKAVSSFEMSANFRLHNATSQTTAIFILITMRTLNFTQK